MTTSLRAPTSIAAGSTQFFKDGTSAVIDANGYLAVPAAFVPDMLHAGYVQPFPRGIPFNKLVATTAATSTAVAGNMEGAYEVALTASGQAAVSLTTRTADQIIAGIPGAQVGETWRFRVINNNSDTLTLVKGTGVTLTGTATIAKTATGEFVGSYDAASAVSFTRVE